MNIIRRCRRVILMWEGDVRNWLAKKFAYRPPSLVQGRLEQLILRRNASHLPIMDFEQICGRINMNDQVSWDPITYAVRSRRALSRRSPPAYRESPATPCGGRDSAEGEATWRRGGE